MGIIAVKLEQFNTKFINAYHYLSEDTIFAVSVLSPWITEIWSELFELFSFKNNCLFVYRGPSKEPLIFRGRMFIFTGHWSMMGKLLNTEYKKIWFFIQVLWRCTFLHTYRHICGIPETTLSYLQGLRVCKSIKILRSVSFIIVILPHMWYMYDKMKSIGNIYCEGKLEKLQLEGIILMAWHK
jgi:hypothetical protein